MGRSMKGRPGHPEWTGGARAGRSLLATGTLLVLLASGVCAAPASPGDDAWPRLLHGTAEERTFVSHRTYRYWERRYDPPVLVEQLAGPVGGIRGPEQTLFELVSAMRAGDFDWWLGLHDSEARARLEGALERPGHTPEDLKAGWQARFRGRPVELTRWIETGRYLVLVYRLGGEGTAAGGTGPGGNGRGSGPGEEIPVVLTTKEGQWLVSFDLEDDPVVKYFDAPALQGAGTMLRVRRIMNP